MEQAELLKALINQKNGSPDKAPVEKGTSNTVTEQVVAAPVTATIESSVKANGKETKVFEERKVVEEKFYAENPVRVWIDYSYTKPLRPYETAKINIGLSMPVGKEIDKDTRKQIDVAHDFAMKWIGEKIKIEIDRLGKFMESREKNDGQQ